MWNLLVFLAEISYWSFLLLLSKSIKVFFVVFILPTTTVFRLQDLVPVIRTYQCLLAIVMSSAIFMLPVMCTELGILMVVISSIVSQASFWDQFLYIFNEYGVHGGFLISERIEHQI